MKKGFYVRLAANNIRKNGKLYIPYLFTCVLSVVMFYVMMSLSLDPAVKKMFAGGCAFSGNYDGGSGKCSAWYSFWYSFQ